MARRRAGWPGMAATALVLGDALPAQAQALFICDLGASGRVFAGTAAAPGCSEIRNPARDLMLAPAEPDIAALTRQLTTLSARVDRLEILLLGARARSRETVPAARRPADDFDTRQRMRDLGQDLDRRLDR